MICEFPDRVYAQYRTKPKAVEWYNINPTVAAPLCQGYEQVAAMWDIDDAEGEQLDIIGRIVGLDRPSVSGAAFSPSTFGDGDTFGDGGSIAGTTDVIPDSLYRVLIKSKIVKNNSDAQIDDVIAALIFITGDAQPIVNDNEDMSFDVTFSTELDPIVRLALANFDIVPRPQGVEFAGFIELPSTTVFGGGEFGNPVDQFGGAF